MHPAARVDGPTDAASGESEAARPSELAARGRAGSGHARLRRPGRYELEQLLEDAAGVSVWVARDRQLDRLVLYEECHADAGQDRVAETQFRCELERLARLTHPAFVPLLYVSDEGRSEGTYGVFGLPPERALSQAIAELHTHEPGRKPVRGLDLLAQIAALNTLAQGVTFAHELGLSHGRLTSTNVRLAPLGAVYLPIHGWHLDPSPAERPAEVGDPAPTGPASPGVESAFDLDARAMNLMLGELLTGEERVWDRAWLETNPSLVRDTQLALRRFSMPDETREALARLADECVRGVDGGRFRKPRELSEEVRRLLIDLPPTGRPPARRLRPRRVARRNASLLAASCAVLGCLLIASEASRLLIGRRLDRTTSRLAEATQRLDAAAERETYLDATLLGELGGDPFSNGPQEGTLGDSNSRLLAERAFDYGELLQRQDVLPVDSRKRFASLYWAIGRVLGASDPRGIADQAFNRAEGTLDSLYKKDPDSATFASRLAGVRVDRGAFLQALGRDSQAGALYAGALDSMGRVREFLASKEGVAHRLERPDDLLRWESRAHVGLAELGLVRGDVDAAERHFAQASGCLEQAIGRSLPARNDRVLISRIMRGRATVAGERAGFDAESELLEAAFERLVDGEGAGTSPPVERERARLHLARARALARRSAMIDEAIEQTLAARVILESVLGSDPSNRIVEFELAEAEAESGALFARTGGDGRAELQQALARVEHGLASMPPCPAGQRLRSRCLGRLGTAVLGRGHTILAGRLLREAVSEMRLLTDGDSARKEDDRDLSDFEAERRRIVP